MEELPLPGLIPGDPQNRLSPSARRRVERANLEAERIRWEAEANIDARHLRKERKQYLRNQANLKGARAILSALATEFDAAGFTWREYWAAMREEIEGIGNSLSLSGVQRRLLEVEFHHPPDRKPTPRRNSSADPALPIEMKESVGAQIKRLRVQCEWTEEDLAEAVDMDIRSVQRHLASDTAPRALTIRKYEKAFSKLLKKEIVISQMP